MEDAKEAVTSQRSFTVFELLRYVSQGQTRQAVSSLRNLLLAGESPLGILALLARQIRILWQAKDGAERKMPVAELAQKINLPAAVSGATRNRLSSSQKQNSIGFIGSFAKRIWPSKAPAPLPNCTSRHWC